MVAAAQPYLSGGSSKTVNMPDTATVDEIMNTYIEGWRLGLKAIAIYRDGSKRSAPLNTRKTRDMGASADGGGRATISERGQFQDGQHAGHGDRRRDHEHLHRRLASRSKSDRHLPRRLEAFRAVKHA